MIKVNKIKKQYEKDVELLKIMDQEEEKKKTRNNLPKSKSFKSNK